MGTTTELSGEITHRYHTYLLGILLAKQCHSTGLLCFLNIHDIGMNLKSCLNLLIYNFFNFTDFLSSHSCEVGKVETKSVSSYKRTLLLYMRTKNFFQSFLKKMCRTVVLLDIFSCSNIYFQRNGLSLGNHARFHISYMTEFAAAKLDGIFYDEFAICSLDHTGISNLTSHSCIERCFLYENSTLLSFHQGIYDLSFCGKNSNRRFKGKVIVSNKLCGNRSIDLVIYSSVSSHIIGYLTGGTCFLSLLIHSSLEAFLVDLVALLLKDLLGQIKRESIGII